MAMHGPHQGAQKSTTRGRSPRARCRSKFASVSSMGFPSNNGKWHFGQRGASFNRAPGRRTTESQCPHTTCTASFIDLKSTFKPVRYHRPMQRDYLGNPVGAQCRLPLRGIDDFIEGYLAYETRAERVLAAADADPESCLANVYAGMLWMLLEAPAGARRAAGYLAAA